MSGVTLTIPVVGIPPEGRDVAGAASLQGLLGDWRDVRIRCPEALTYQLHVSEVRGGVLVQGRAVSTIIAQCDRCLGTFRRALEVVDICHFYPTPEGEELDLTVDIREDTLLAFPDRLVCRENCRGLCPDCGQNLNVKDCGCQSRKRTDDPWSSLDELEIS
ncbi:MAG: DUF177 domain-containing protein [Kiritimatiellaeota bacterium]|nr:DUF177 domain-containing protein [Kiritimatiellota bacterium]